MENGLGKQGGVVERRPLKAHKLLFESIHSLLFYQLHDIGHVFNLYSLAFLVWITG